MRTKRWTPFSDFIYPKAFSPLMRNVALLMPASSPTCSSIREILYPCFSAHRKYIRINIEHQSCASVPPAPAWNVRMALFLSYSPLNKSNTSRCSTSWVNCSTIVVNSPSIDVSSSSMAISNMSFASSMSVTSFLYPSTASFNCVASWEISRAESGSFQKSGSLIFISNVNMRSSF